LDKTKNQWVEIRLLQSLQTINCGISYSEKEKPGSGDFGKRQRFSDTLGEFLDWK